MAQAPGSLQPHARAPRRRQDGKAQPRKEPAEKQESPGFLFVNCDGPLGRSAGSSKAMANRHVMLRHLSKSSHTAPSRPAKRVMINFKVDKQAKWAEDASDTSSEASHGGPLPVSPNVHDVVRTRNYSLLKQPRARNTIDPFDCLAAINIIGTHGFLDYYQPATAEVSTPWVNKYFGSLWKVYWPMARDNAGFYHTLCAYMKGTEPQALSLVDTKSLYQSKVLSLQFLQKVLKSGDDRIAVAAIIMQLSLAVREGNLGEAQTHITALERLKPEALFGAESGSTWFNDVASGTSASILTGSAPFWDYWLHPACTFEDMLDPLLHASAYAKMDAVMDLVPTVSDSCLDVATIRTLFLHMFLLTEASHELHAIESILGLFYDLQYHLCQRLASARELIKTMDSGSPVSAMHVLLLAANLLIWTVFSHGLRPHFSMPKIGASMTLQAIAIAIHAKQDFCAYWKSHAGLTSLIWVLFIACAYAATGIGTAQQNSLARELLNTALDRLKITHVLDMDQLLRRFPWIQGWSDRKVAAVWYALGRQDGVLWRDRVTAVDSSEKTSTV